MGGALSEFRVRPALGRNDRGLKRPAGSETIRRIQVAGAFLGIPAVDGRRGGVIIFLHCAPVAQLDRASGYEPEGREFESPRAHHFLWM
jgi:hypothetical protein